MEENMRRHINRIDPVLAIHLNVNELDVNAYDNHRNRVKNTPKRGPKNRQRLWEGLPHFTIEKGKGVVFHA
jgi:hypothetical protein